jgi:hypothetical protein
MEPPISVTPLIPMQERPGTLEETSMYVHKKLSDISVNDNGITIIKDPELAPKIDNSSTTTPPSQAPTTNGAKSMQQTLLEKAQLLPSHPKDKLKAKLLSAFLADSDTYYRQKPELKRLIFEMQMAVFAQGLSSDKKSRKRLHQLITEEVKKRFTDQTLCDKFITYINKKFGDKAEKKLGTERLMHFRGDERGAEFDPVGTSLDRSIIRSGSKSFFLLQPEHGLGEGQSGRVCRAILLTPGADKPAAAKQYFDAKHHTVENELGIVSKLTDNDHVSRIRDSAHLSDRALLFMDFAEHGDCVDVQVAIAAMPDGEEKDKARLSLGRQYVKALAALHAHEPPIRHVDFKPDNLLLTADGRVIVVDFGVSTTGNKFRTLKDGATCFPPTKEYADPQAKTDAGTPDAADLFALGMTLYALVTHTYPEQIYALKADGKRDWTKYDPDWKGFDTTKLGPTGKELKEVATMLMDADPTRRPSLEQVLELPCFKDKGVYSNEELVGLVKSLKTKDE